MIITKDMHKDITEKIARHWKSSGVEVEVGLTLPISLVQFRKCLQHMMSINGGYNKEHDEVLDIITGKYRYSVVGKSNISAFCKNEMGQGLYTVMSKEKMEKIDIQEYGCRIRVSKETDVKDPPTLGPSSDKKYRLKKRFSVYFEGGKIAVDFTIVKSGSGKVFSSTKFSVEEYEIEVEYMGQTKAPPDLGTLLDYTEELLKSIRDEEHIAKLSERGSVVSEYLNIVKEHMSFQVTDALIKANPRKVFIGPQPVTLEAKSVATLGAGDYSVTEKADGQRYLLYVNSKGSVYLINNRLDIKNTMWTSAHSKSILDCECTTLANGEIHILVFDCYFSKGQSVFPKGLVERLDAVEVVCKGCAASTGDSAYKAIRRKKFYFGDVFKGARDILKKTEFAYTTDGLIFTPVSPPAQLGGTCHTIWKWKPPHDNTIDFLVRYQRHDSGQDIVNADGMKTLLLYVGSVSVGAKEYFEKTVRGYNAKLFTPSGAGDYMTWRTLVPSVAKCANGDEIVHGSVVEMSFDLAKGIWMPLRVRHDKTAESQGVKTITANSMLNAEAVWKTIVNPIAEAVIIGDVAIDTDVADDVDEGKYYARDVERDKSLTLPMVTFHNFWVKNKCLINKFNGKCTSLMDLACGKGGDLSKWIFGHFTTVIGVDVFEDNINNNVDGIYKRLLDWGSRMPQKSKYAFVPMDSGKVIDETTIGGIKDDYMRGLAKCMWGFDKHPPPALKHVAGIAKDKVDVVSVQFALHYFFESDSKLTGFLKNVDNHLKNGGFFIGTCFDGAAIAELMASSAKGETKKGTKNGKTIWSIKKMYDKFDPKKLGQEIEVYVETINQYHVEALVSYDLLVKSLAKYNIKPLSQKECAEFGFSESMSRFGTLFNRMIEENKSILEKRADPKYKDNSIVLAHKMSECEDERTFSFLNMAFVFRKGNSK